MPVKAPRKIAMTLNLPEPEYKALDAISIKESKSKTILIREAVAMLVEDRKAKAA